jgi:hypothetical protein
MRAQKMSGPAEKVPVLSFGLHGLTFMFNIITTTRNNRKPYISIDTSRLERQMSSISELAAILVASTTGTPVGGDRYDSG